MLIKKQITFILCFALLSAGCTVLYNPKISPVKPGMIPEYSFNQSVRVVNVQNTQTVMIEGTPSPWAVNLREITDVAVELTKEELSKKGFQIQDNANKVLQVIVGDVQYGGTLCVYCCHKCTMVLRAIPGNEDYKYYEVYNFGYSWPDVCDFSITKAVSAMLSDEYIINYLMND